jgi:hypothetical protein
MPINPHDNYPPGVDGTEIEIAGAYTTHSDVRWCGHCQTVRHGVTLDYGHYREFECGVCDETTVKDV